MYVNVNGIWSGVCRTGRPFERRRAKQMINGIFLLVFPQSRGWNHWECHVSSTRLHGCHELEIEL